MVKVQIYYSYVMCRERKQRRKGAAAQKHRVEVIKAPSAVPPPSDH